MLLICSAGHLTNTDKFSLSSSMYKEPGDKCGQLLRYDVMSGSTYCQRRLKLLDKTNQVERLFQEVTKDWLPSDWESSNLIPDDMKQYISEFLSQPDTNELRTDNDFFQARFAFENYMGW